MFQLQEGTLSEGQKEGQDTSEGDESEESDLDEVSILEQRFWTSEVLRTLPVANLIQTRPMLRHYDQRSQDWTDH